MVKFTEFTFQSADRKTNIHVRRFDPDCIPIGIIQIAHGISEHCGRYDAFMEFLADNGFVAVANDHLGHGKSIADEGSTGFFAEKNGWDLVVTDMHRLHEMLALEFPSLPFFLFGHSMGSFLSRTYIIKYPQELNGVVICGTGQYSSLLISAGKAIAKLLCTVFGTKHRSSRLYNMALTAYNKGYGKVRTPYDWLSRDTATVDKYIADPLCGIVPTMGLLRDMLGGIAFISNSKNIKNMRKDLPVLFISGSMDPVGANGSGVIKAYEMYDSVGMSDLAIKLYTDCRHELLNELNRGDVLNDVLSWMNCRL